MALLAFGPYHISDLMQQNLMEHEIHFHIEGENTSARTQYTAPKGEIFTIDVYTEKIELIVQHIETHILTIQR